MKVKKNKIYIDAEGDGWVCDCVNPLNLTRLRYPNFSWIGHQDNMDAFFIETDIEYTPTFWDKAGLKEIQEYWDEIGRKAKIVKFNHDLRVRN